MKSAGLVQTFRQKFYACQENVRDCLARVLVFPKDTSLKSTSEGCHSLLIFHTTLPSSMYLDGIVQIPTYHNRIAV